MMRRALLAAACIGAVGLVALTEAFLVPAVTTPAARAAMGWTCSSQQQQRTLLQQGKLSITPRRPESSLPSG